MNSLLAILTGLSVLAATARSQLLVDHTCTEVDRIPQAQLDRARQLDLFFCHASVGMSMVSGLSSLAKADPTRYALTIPGAGTAATWFDSNDGLVQSIDWAGLGGNGSPLGKIQGFVELLDNRGFGGRADVAFMKFCYLDVMATTDVAKVWTAYRDAMLALQTRHPTTTIVWVTGALNALGADGAKRAEFNRNVRDYCRTNQKPLFDLAAIESHDPAGNLALDDYGNETIWAGYTDDNGHLATLGRDRVGKAMWWLFARLAGWSVTPTAIQASANTPILAANGNATAEVTAELVDSGNAIPVRSEERTLSFQLTGPGSLVGPNPVTTLCGVARIGYRAGTTTGTAQIRVTSPGLTAGDARIELVVNQAPAAPANLRCDGLKDPSGVARGDPPLTWDFSDADQPRGDRQSAMRLLLADNPVDLAADFGNIWDSGKTARTEGTATPATMALRPGIRYQWKVMSWDASDVPGPWSATASFDLADRLGFAAHADAAGGRIDFGKGSSLDVHDGNATGLTIEMWLCRTRAQPGIVLDHFVLNGGGYRVGIDAGGYLYFRAQGARDRRVTGIGKPLELGKWYHVVGQTAGAVGAVFIDGVQQGSNGLINIPRSVATAGTWLDTAGVLVDELRISNVKRYAGSFSPPLAPFALDASTVGLWHFDEGWGPRAGDASGNGNHGTTDPEQSWGAGRLAGTRTPGAYGAFGRACGPRPPRIGHRGYPEVGGDFSPGVTAPLPGAPAALFTGFSRTVWGSLPLPLPLDPLGAPGCALVSAIDILQPAVLGASGDTWLGLTVPGDAALVGARFWQQWTVYDASANQLRLVFSQGGEARIGG